MWHQNCFESPVELLLGDIVASRLETSNPSAYALWLDSEGLPPAEGVAALHTVGLQAIPLGSAGELGISPVRVQMVVVRLHDDTAPLREILQAMRSAPGSLPVVCRVDRHQLALGIRAMREGATHVLASDDWTTNAWREPMNLIAQAPSESRSFVFVDPVSLELLALARRVAQAGVTTLLTGPTGAGKEVLARVLHDASSRCNAPFVGLNCAAMPESMMEDMLFGHEKGAFTGAAREHPGVFEQANGGTLFLDEIAEIPVALQSKLLRVLQERQVTRLGGQTAINIDVRLIAATNRDLRAGIAAREFREDLYFRISTFRLRIPALAERPGDIVPLAQHLLEMHAPGGRDWRLTAQAEQALESYAWPGNVRELSNVIQRALVLSAGPVIDTEHLLFEEPIDVQSNAVSIVSRQPEQIEAPANPALDAAVRDSEYRTISAVLRTSPNRIEAARTLGISPRTLRYKLARFKEMGHSISAERG